VDKQKAARIFNLAVTKALVDTFFSQYAGNAAKRSKK
tara:strand:- start:639 stop:749 length:111 start_codon:yes stop_codon:yes gene_type:complete